MSDEGENRSNYFNVQMSSVMLLDDFFQNIVYSKIVVDVDDEYFVFDDNGFSFYID